MLKVLSLKNDNLGVNYNELNALMNGVNLHKYSIRISKKVKNSIVGVDAIVDLQVDLPKNIYLKLKTKSQSK